jgi:SulP family sulfate permease
MSQLIRELSPGRLLPSLAAGLVTAIIQITVATAFAVLVFSGDLSDYVPVGVGYMLFAAVIIATLMGLFSSFPGLVAGLQDSAVAILALVSAAIVQSMPASATPQETFATVVAAVALASLLTGVAFLILGYFKLGDLIRYIPYPVIGGFLAGTGLLLVQGAVLVMIDAPLGPSLTRPDLLAKWLPGLAFAVLLLVVSRRSGHFLIMPGMLLAASVIFFVVLWLAHITTAEATAQGWLLGSLPEGGLWQPPTLSDLGRVNWSVLRGQVGSLAAIVLVSVLSLLLNATGIELVTGHEMDLNRELTVAGVANLVAGLGGGMVGFHVLSDTALVHKMGVRGRMGGIVLSAVCGAVLLAGGALLSLFPNFVLGGLLLFLGLGFLIEWVYDAWFTLPRIDYLLVVLILVVIGAVGFLQGVGLGVVVAVILFVVDYSRIGVVKHQLSGISHRSNVERPRLYRQLLRRKGHWLHILKLHGFIFFGTANRLFEQVRRRANDLSSPSPRYVVLDFRLVTGLDSSAAFSFAKMRQLAEREDIVLVFTHLSTEIRRQLEKVAFEGGEVRVFPDLDHGVEWCEDQMIATFESVGLAVRPQTLMQQLGDALSQADGFADLRKYLSRKEVQPGDCLVRQGDAPGGIYFIETGRVTCQLELADGSTVRLRTMDAGTVVGELGTYLNAPATASVVAGQPTTLLHLSVDALRQMEAEDPALALAFHRFMAELMAERVASTNDTIEALLQ